MNLVPPPESPQPQLIMRRPDLDTLPDLRLPPGYVLRASAAGDGIHWVAIINASFGGSRTPEAFDTSMLAAIKTYLRLGFDPLIAHESHPDRWTAVLRQLGWPVPGYLPTPDEQPRSGGPL